MGLYDGYKLENSSYIPQFVGSIVPELKDLSTIVQKRYNEARDTDDALVEAMSNLQHLGTEEDTTYANELKQNYLSKVMQRSEREDYENMGRRTKRDAVSFSSDYTPLLNRMKGMQDINQRVLQDKDISAPETKQKILKHISIINKAQKDPTTGDFVRDGSGKIQLGAIQDWAYAPDVDIDKKTIEILKELETTERQTAYRSNGTGLMTSNKYEFRDPKELASLARERLMNDPAVKAMIERDVTLTADNYGPQDFKAIADKENVSLYTQMKRAGNSDAAISAYLKGRKEPMSLEVAKLKPLDVLRSNYEQKGMTADQADEAYVKNKIREGIMAPHIDLVSRVLKVDKQSLEAREDPAFAARALAGALSILVPKGFGDVAISAMPSDVQEIPDANVTHNAAVEAEGKVAASGSELQSYIGRVLHLPTSDPKGVAKWNEVTKSYLNNSAKQGALVAKLKETNPQAANDLSVAFNAYKTEANKVIYNRQKLEQLNSQVDFKTLHNDYLKTQREQGEKKVMSFELFKREMLKSPKMEKTSFLGAEGYSRSDEGFVKRLTGQGESFALSTSRQKYMESLQKAAKGNEKSGIVLNQTFEPISESGWLANHTKSLQSRLADGSLPAKNMSTGKLLIDELKEELDPSDKDITDPKSDYNQALKNLSARFNVGMRGANGEATASVKLPSGKVVSVVLDEAYVSKSLPGEMAQRTLAYAGQHMTRSEATNLMQSSNIGMGYASVTELNQVDLHNIKPNAKAQKLNDMFYLKVTGAGVKGVGNGITNVYTLFADTNGDGKLESTKLVNKSSMNDVMNYIGALKQYQESPKQVHQSYIE